MRPRRQIDGRQAGRSAAGFDERADRLRADGHSAAVLHTRSSFWTNRASELLAPDSGTDIAAGDRNRLHPTEYESAALVPLRSEGGIIASSVSPIPARADSAAN